ncbi:ParB N-terminal domain-containing protein [Arthrobacter sedimenti]|uniref:hypothetical protein n=1 Tax=Arthrobacter sedimenti TaxID=2694931 RepID=UPI00111F406C|nr:hypothetical protein [Arthrobacter sedimenti]
MMKAFTGSKRDLKISFRFFLVASSILLSAVIFDASNWTYTDLANFLISVILSVYFLFLAQRLNWRAEERAEAVANADLITSTGVLAMNSARSLSGSESAALRVAADARAALQHYPAANQARQEDLRASVVNAYNDLAFSVFLRAGTLARSVWARLCEGTADVIRETDELVFSPSKRIRDKELMRVADHIGFIEMLGRALRKNGEVGVAVFESISLPAVWDPLTTIDSRRPPVRRSARTETIHRLNRFEMLYQDELTVLHDWSTLRDNADRLSCEVELVDSAATDEWLAPWFVGQGTDGSARPVNVLNCELEERAKYDTLRINATTPRWPQALKHGEIPEGMRATSIDNLCQVLEAQPTPIICVLAYELYINGHTGEKKRVVLDGNHRLAAARRLSLTPGSSDRTHHSHGFKVLTFLIRELRPINSVVSAGGRKKHPYEWKGFTPDIGLIRGTWRPKQSAE